MTDIVPASYARRGGVITKALGRLVLRFMGWRFEGVMPDVPKLVVAVAPHTSNWDFVIGALGIWALDIQISFLGKHTLFHGWFGRWVRSIGGIPVDRSQSHGVVGETVAAFDRVDRMVLAIAPEGTRQLDKDFKSGFLHIAYAAKTPVLLAFFDFSRKVVGFGPLIIPSGDAARDMIQIHAFYRPIRGRYRKRWQDAPI